MARTILAEHRPISIHEVPEGATVKIVGRVRKHQARLRSPLSAREAVYYDVVLTGIPHRRVSRPLHERGSHPLRIEERDAVDFLVEDDTGRAIVRTDDVLVAVVRDRDEDLGRSGEPEVRALLERYGRNKSQRVHVREGLIEIGEPVAVVGRASWIQAAPDAPASYRERPQILSLEAPDEHPLIISDDPDTFD